MGKHTEKESGKDEEKTPVGDFFPSAKFDEFGDISFTGEIVRLDTFANQLRAHPESVGHIIVYAGRLAQIAAAATRAKRAKMYLVKNRGIDERRITAIAGGRREELSVELFIQEPGHLAPSASPTVNAVTGNPSGSRGAPNKPAPSDTRNPATAVATSSKDVATFAVKDDLRIKIIRVVQAFDCGAVVNPMHLKNQIEGAITQAIGGAMFEAIQFGNGKILNPKFSLYRLPRFSDTPPIEVVLVNRKDIPSAGAGETPIVGLAPAVGNAIFNAAAVRLRSLPLMPKV